MRTMPSISKHFLKCYLFELVNECFLVTFEFGDRSIDSLGSSNTFITNGRKTTCKNSFSDQSDRLSEIKSIDSRPLSGTLIALALP